MSRDVNKNGHPATLEPRHPGNENRLAHAAYSASDRALAPRAEEIADALMTMAHVAPLDRLAAEEIGQLVALLERVDADLASRGLTRKNGEGEASSTCGAARPAASSAGSRSSAPRRRAGQSSPRRLRVAASPLR